MSHRLRIPVVALLPLAAAAGCSDDPFGGFADVFDLDTTVDVGTGGADAGGDDAGAADTGGTTDTGGDDGGVEDSGGDDASADAGEDVVEDAGPGEDADDDVEDAGTGEDTDDDVSDAGEDADDDATDAGDDVTDTSEDAADATDAGADVADATDTDFDGGDIATDTGGDAGDTGTDGGGLPPDAEAVVRAFCELSLECTEFPFYESLEECVEFRSIFFRDLLDYYGDDCAAAYAEYVDCATELDCDDYYYAYSVCDETYEAFIGSCFDDT